MLKCCSTLCYILGWEKAENEVTALKQQLEAAVQQNMSLEVKNSHLDGALKECVRQLRQARDEHETRISDALAEKSREWESTRAEFERRILDLQSEAEAARTENSVNPDTLIVLEALEKENSSLKKELVSFHRELEVVAIERDLSTKSAETASKLQLESIKKVAKLEAECRKLQSLARKSSPLNSQKSASASSFHAESLTGSEPDVDQFKNEKPSTKNIAALSLDIDMMDDFLEMERLAALDEKKNNASFVAAESATAEASSENPLMAELESMTSRVADLENMLEKTEAERSELQNALDETVNALYTSQSRIAEAELALKEMQNELSVVYETRDSLEFQLSSMEVELRTKSSSVDSLKAEVLDERKLSAELMTKCQALENELTTVMEESEIQQIRIDELENELTAVYEAKELLESQLSTAEVESRALSSSLNSLKAELEGERKLSDELTNKCQELESDLTRTIQEYELHLSMHSNSEVKVKQVTIIHFKFPTLKPVCYIKNMKYQMQTCLLLQEDFAVAADKLSECQKTIASLGRQLQSLATLEDFFIDTSSIPGYSRDSSGSDTVGEMWRLPSNTTFLANGNKDLTRSSSISPSSTNHATAAKNWNSFGKLFSRSKSVAEHEIGQE